VRLLAASGDWWEAKVQFDLVRPFDPGAVDKYELQTHVLYGDVEEASRRLAEHPELAGVALVCWKQILAARRKEKLDAAQFAENCSGGDKVWSARFFALAGDLDGAFRAMDEFFKSNERHFAPHIFYPEMREFLRDPRFWPLASKLGLVDYWLDTDQWPDFCSEPDLPFDCKEKALAARAAAKG
jgi:hypothetical protein